MTTPSQPATPVATPRASVAWSDAERHAAFEAWLAPLAAARGLDPDSLRPASADASFRRYLRIEAAAGPSLIVMDAPPPQEDVRPFIHVAALIQAAGLHGPEVLASDVERGFLLLTDLGHRLYLDALNEATASQAEPLSRTLRKRCTAARAPVDTGTSRSRPPLPLMVRTSRSDVTSLVLRLTSSDTRKPVA